MPRPWALLLAVAASSACASAARYVERDELGLACQALFERDTDEARAAIRPALADSLDLRWTMRVLTAESATSELGVPVVQGEHGVLVRIGVSLESAPRGADSVSVSVPAVFANGQRMEPARSGHPAHDLLLPAPAQLVEVDVPPEYSRAPFEPSEPYPDLEYERRSGKEPAPAKIIRTTVEAMTLGLVKGSKPGPRLTPRSRRKLKAWRERHRAEYEAWDERESKLARERNAARKAAHEHNVEVFKRLRAWEEDREGAWRRVTDWPCATRPLRVGDSCEGLVFVPAPNGDPLTLRFMATTDFPLEDEGCSLTLAGTTAPARDLPALFAPWSESTSQRTIAPADYVAATPYLN